MAARRAEVDMDKRPIWRYAGLALAAALPAASACAQLEGMLGKGKGEGASTVAGLAGMQSGSMGNVAGLLQYCIGNNYLSGEGAASVKNKLMGKLPGGAQTRDPGYSDGRKGLLHGRNGELVDLGGGQGDEGSSEGGSRSSDAGGALSADLKKRACDTILSQAKSFL
jgi:hypothetical protein